MFSLCICTTYYSLLGVYVFFFNLPSLPFPIQVNTLNKIISIAKRRKKEKTSNEYIIFMCCTVVMGLDNILTTWNNEMSMGLGAHIHSGREREIEREKKLLQFSEKSTDFLWISVKRRAHRWRQSNSSSNSSSSSNNEFDKNVKIGQSSGWVIDTIVWYWIFGCMNVAFLSDPIKMEINSCSKVSNAKQNTRETDGVHTVRACVCSVKIPWWQSVIASGKETEHAKKFSLKILVSVYFLFMCFTLKCDNTKDRVKKMFGESTDGMLNKMWSKFKWFTIFVGVVAIVSYTVLAHG